MFFFVNWKKAESDELAQQWATNNINYWSLRIIRIMSLIFHKFFRLSYSRLFNALPLSLVYKNRSNVFTVATIFTVITLIVCEIPLLGACFSLVYFKLLKDQLFYTCIESMIVTSIAIILSLIDIYKSEDFF